jgi:D-threo-aldose 1-dehydrogenase
VQIPNSIWDMNINLLPSDREGLTVTHSSLTSRFHALLARLSSDQPLAREWQSRTQVDPRDATALAQLLLAHALSSNPTGVILFFSSNPTNIKANVRLFKERRIDDAQIEGLNEFVASKFSPLAK